MISETILAIEHFDCLASSGGPNALAAKMEVVDLDLKVVLAKPGEVEALLTFRSRAFARSSRRPLRGPGSKPA